jgi:hypothetical protein
MPGIRCLQIDAFTDRPFAGNPAAVCLLDGERDDNWMQAVRVYTHVLNRGGRGVRSPVDFDDDRSG